MQYKLFYIGYCKVVYEKNRSKKLGKKELRKSQIYNLLVIAATLDCMTKQCCQKLPTAKKLKNR
ncbi:MAG: hypothetical protein WBI07_09075 [Mobilitalea sp.]